MKRFWIAMICAYGFSLPGASSAEVTFNPNLWGGSPIFIPAQITAPGFDPVSIFNSENSSVALPGNVEAFRLGEIPLPQTLTWHLPRNLNEYQSETTIHSIEELKLVVFMIKSNGRYVVRLEGSSGSVAITAPNANTWVGIQIFDAPGDLVETAEVSYGTPKCGPVSSGVDQINSNPLLYAAEISVRTLASGFLPELEGAHC